MSGDSVEPPDAPHADRSAQHGPSGPRMLGDIFRAQGVRLSALDDLRAAVTGSLTQHVMAKLRFTPPGMLGVQSDAFAGLNKALGIDSALKASLDVPSQSVTRNLAAALASKAFSLKLSAGARAALTDLLARWLPPNWRPRFLSDRAIEIVQQDGIPLVWVPRAEIVESLLAAPDRVARETLLIGRSADIAQDCSIVLTHIEDEALGGQVPLARRAIEAFADGHHEAAQALAVQVADPTITQNFGRYLEVKGGSYGGIRDAVFLDRAFVPLTRLRLHAALAPVHRFLTRWHPGDPQPRPKELSRHVAAHQADATHFTKGNAVIAIMLMTSLLRAAQELHAFQAAAATGAAA